MLLLMMLLFTSASSAFRLQGVLKSGKPRMFGQERIVGGEPATYGEFPNQISLLWKFGGGHLCGGSIYNRDYVITAGHCCDSMAPHDLEVVYGSQHLNSQDEFQGKVKVSKITIHHNFDLWTFKNDICLLKLERSLHFNHYVKSISLPIEYQDESAGTVCTVTGWGLTTEGGEPANELMKVDVPIVADDVCQDQYAEEEILPSMICAGLLGEGGKDSCQGDSGGPLMCNGQLTGIVSWGYGCAMADYPGVYTQTSYFVSWIAQNSKE